MTRDRSVGFRVSDDYIARHPEADPSATELIINIVFAGELVRGHLERLARQHGLSSAGFNMLEIVRGAGRPLSPTEISAQMVVTTATITGVTDTLVRAGFATRTTDTADRRRVLIDITAEGAARLDEVGAELIELEKDLAAPLNESRRERLIRDLGALQAHLGEPRG